MIIIFIVFWRGFAPSKPLEKKDFFGILRMKFAHAQKYSHIQNDYLSNSKTFQDGNGNGNLGKINSNDFQDGNWESMEMKG